MNTSARLACTALIGALFAFDAAASPERVFENFLALSKVPRCSKHEERVSTWLVDWARQRGLAVRTDARHNVLITVPASKGYEAHPAVVLQAHMDMVCQKTAASTHDFTKDPIVAVRDGDWLRAKDTTLGADDGIGVATALTIAEDKTLAHPPLELLFTTDEEIDMTGAAGLSSDFLKARRFINIDSEQEGTVTLGAAGGLIMDLALPLRFSPLRPGEKVFALRVEGLTGGHSGIEMNQNRANANVIAAQVLAAQVPFRLVGFTGGSAANAITRASEVVLAIPASQEKALRDRVRLVSQRTTARHPAETGLSITLTPMTDRGPVQAASRRDSARAAELAATLPYGVHVWSTKFPGLPETSVNIGIVKTADGAFRLTTYQRSFTRDQLEQLTQLIEGRAASFGATSVRRAGFPAWAPDPSSALYQRSLATYRALFGAELQTVVLHAGLECGYVAEKFPGMEVISIGPTLLQVHTTEERLDVPSVERFWKFTTGLLRDL